MPLLSKFSRRDRIRLLLQVVVAIIGIAAWTTRHRLLGGLILFLSIADFLRLLTWVFIGRALARKLLWRVRNRLFVTYFLVGAVPIVLLFLFATFGLSVVLSQAANTMLHTELDRRLENVHQSAELLARDIYYSGEPAAAIDPAGGAVIRNGNRTRSIPERGSVTEFPEWSSPEFKGIVRDAAGNHFFAATALSGAGERRVEVFAYETMDNAAMAKLLPGLASVLVVAGENIGIRLGGSRNPNYKIVLNSEEIVPTPDQRGFWDLDLESGSPLDVRSMETGKPISEIAVVSSHGSLIVSRLSSTLGNSAVFILILMLVVGTLFLFVELRAVFSIVRLTRTLTRAIHDLHIGTQKVEAGDFTHRISVQSNDQLGELGDSFNTMTQRIEQLIEEVKEKEKLESELEIARQVQSQLFPKEAPKLQTLELAGVCNPARVVSGDYYDFITSSSQWTAVVIGDISGKGISAALLMASVQASLHAQLAMSADGGVSAAELVGRLNRQLYANTSPEKYATFFYGAYDDQSGRLSYTNAGHLPPILVRNGNVTRLETNGTVVGMFPDFPYEQSIVELQSGDLLVAFTDGITEPENAQEEQFGDERLIELLLRNSEKPLNEIARIVMEAVHNWAYDPASQDDITILLARRL